MSKLRIHLLSGPVNRGKSTWLYENIFCNPAVSRLADGVIVLRDDEQRMVHFLKSGNKIPQTATIDEIKSGNCINIGPYFFSANAFEQVRAFLKQTDPGQNRIFILDELGRLELDHKGLEPAFSTFLQRARKSDLKILIIVLRQNITDLLIDKYDLEGCRIFDIEDEEDMRFLKKDILNRVE